MLITSTFCDAIHWSALYTFPVLHLSLQGCLEPRIRRRHRCCSGSWDCGELSPSSNWSQPLHSILWSVYSIVKFIGGSIIMANGTKISPFFVDRSSQLFECLFLEVLLFGQSYTINVFEMMLTSKYWRCAGIEPKDKYNSDLVLWHNVRRFLDIFFLHLTN